MHKTIANGFANILSLFHIMAAVLLALAIIAAFAGIGGPGVGATKIILVALGAIMIYVLLFGFLSTIIRMNQNLERIAYTNETLVEQQSKLIDKIGAMPTEGKGSLPSFLQNPGPALEPANPKHITGASRKPSNVSLR